MRVVANGKDVTLPDGASVGVLVEALGLTGRLLLIERNGEPVERDAIVSTPLREGDRVELVRAVAGG
ncbi:MAG: sulfur carrier protein ThiS [Acidimicrobiia bacterium]